MSEITQRPISDLLGDKNKSVMVEESLSKDLPSTGAQEVVHEFSRDAAITAALARPSARRTGGLPSYSPSLEFIRQVVAPRALKHHFFVMDGRKLTFLGSMDMDISKFAKDISGRFFREWLKLSFPGRRDYEDIVSFDDNATLKDVAELLEMVG